MPEVRCKARRCQQRHNARGLRWWRPPGSLHSLHPAHAPPPPSLFNNHPGSPRSPHALSSPFSPLHPSPALLASASRVYRPIHSDLSVLPPSPSLSPRFFVCLWHSPSACLSTCQSLSTYRPPLKLHVPRRAPNFLARKRPSSSLAVFYDPIAKRRGRTRWQLRRNRTTVNTRKKYMKKSRSHRSWGQMEG